ncbi:hypothetical protein CR63_25425, partial [Escherichia coli NB8]
VEATFESQHQFIDAVITLKPIIETQGTSFILLLHPVEQMRQLMTSQLGKPRFYVSTSKSIIKALINMHSFEIQLSPIG